MSPHPSIRGGFSPRSQFKGPITMDQSVSTPSGASEYAVLRRNNIRLEKGSSHGTLARHSDWTRTVRKREASFENRYSLFFFSPSPSIASQKSFSTILVSFYLIFSAKMSNPEGNKERGRGRWGAGRRCIPGVVRGPGEKGGAYTLPSRKLSVLSHMVEKYGVRLSESAHSWSSRSSLPSSGFAFSL